MMKKRRQEPRTYGRFQPDEESVMETLAVIRGAHYSLETADAESESYISPRRDKREYLDFD